MSCSYDVLGCESVWIFQATAQNINANAGSNTSERFDGSNDMLTTSMLVGNQFLDG